MKANESNFTDVAIAELLRAIPGPIFAATLHPDSEQPSIQIHVARSGSTRAMTRLINSTLAPVTTARVQIKFHRPARLLRAKSLEALVATLTKGRIVYDPTNSFLGAVRLLETSQSLRALLHTRLRGVYYAPLLRTMYISLERAQVERAGKIALSTLTDIECVVAAVVQTCFADSDVSAPQIRVGFGLPETRLVPVDRLSEQGLRARTADFIRRHWKPVAIAALLGLGGSEAAVASEPAVSEPNFKARGSFGEVVDDYTWDVEGAFTVPLGESFGAVIEGGGGAQDGNGYVGAAGHIFMRDPESFMLGVFGGYSEGTEFDVDATRLGGEFEFYLNEITLSGSAGYQFSQALGDKTFGSFDIKWYVSRNFAISGGAFGDADKTFGRGRLEWQPGFAALPGLAFNINGMWGEDDYQSIMGGLTYYFGTPVDLIDRHRRQDPESALFGLLQSVQHEQAKIAERLCAQYGQC
ncbi:MAG: hypothetical protein ABL973_16315 [Micropepsaceae bacterium]